MVPSLTNEALALELEEVRDMMVRSIRRTSVGGMLGDFDGVLAGKMLRARLSIRIGVASDTAPELYRSAAAAVEMIHAASLLHDDVIDGAELRRAAPSFWMARGVSGAILLGDLLVCQAFGLARAGDHSITDSLVELSGVMCDAEAEQELVPCDEEASWDKCVNIARRKTGSLFAFAASAFSGDNPELLASLREAGYKLGTAYQMADDMLDAYGDSGEAGKTLGSDAGREKTTVASACRDEGTDPAEYISGLCDESKALLTPWPGIAKAWEEYLSVEMVPVIDSFTDAMPMVVAS